MKNKWLNLSFITYWLSIVLFTVSAFFTTKYIGISCQNQLIYDNCYIPFRKFTNLESFNIILKYKAFLYWDVVCFIGSFLTKALSDLFYRMSL